jgi:hypothetical protein
MPPLVDATPDDAPDPPRVDVTAEHVPLGTVVEMAPAVVWLKLVKLAAGSAMAGEEARTVASATSATPHFREAAVNRLHARLEAIESCIEWTRSSF